MSTLRKKVSSVGTCPSALLKSAHWGAFGLRVRVRPRVRPFMLYMTLRFITMIIIILIIIVSSVLRLRGPLSLLGMIDAGFYLFLRHFLFFYPLTLLSCLIMWALSNTFKWLDYVVGAGCFYWIWEILVFSLCTCNLEQHAEQSKAYTSCLSSEHFKLLISLFSFQLSSALNFNLLYLFLRFYYFTDLTFYFFVLFVTILT